MDFANEWILQDLASKDLITKFKKIERFNRQIKGKEA